MAPTALQASAHLCYAFFSEAATAADVNTSDQTDTLTTVAHAYAVSISALDA